MSTVSGFIFIVFVIWFWLDSARAREIAIGICELSCKQRGLQFLDQTVALSGLGIQWTARGIRVKRLFRFDFSEEGLERRSGHITLVGIELADFSLGLPSDTENIHLFPLKPEEETKH
ncbi:MAG: DUF3301 domain-containing protein [Gammaproteobacteria bacterium]|nr:DUF3301 domain-containing protein [Gammaproteobacteria bacterium]MCP5444583.1 DUF3301 domain-containing protein [Chromatiaceae bacterium]